MVHVGMSESAKEMWSQPLPWLFLLNFCIMFTNSMLMPIRESLTLCGGKALQAKLMLATTAVSIVGSSVFSSSSAIRGGAETMRRCFMISSAECLFAWLTIMFFNGAAYFDKSSVGQVQSPGAPTLPILLTIGTFYLYFTFYNMMSMSAFWAIAGDILSDADNDNDDGDINNPKDIQQSHSPSLVKLREEGSRKRPDLVERFGKLAAGGTLGQVMGALTASAVVQMVGTVRSLLILGVAFGLTIEVIHQIIIRFTRSRVVEAKDLKSDGLEMIKNQSLMDKLSAEIVDNLAVANSIWCDDLLRNAFFYSIFLSMVLGLVTLERTSAASSSSIGNDDYASIIAVSVLCQGAIQFFIQYQGTRTLISTIGLSAATMATGISRFIVFLILILLHSRMSPSLSAWYFSVPLRPVACVIFTDLLCRLVAQTVAKPVRESMWTLVSPSLKYRAKIAVDVFAHRVGTSSAALLSDVRLHFLHRLNVENHLAWGLLTSTLFSCVGYLLSKAIFIQEERNRKST